MPHQKISVNLPDEVLRALREIAANDSVTQTEALRRSISTMKFLQEAQREGKAILIRDPATMETDRLIFR